MAFPLLLALALGASGAGAAINRIEQNRRQNDAFAAEEAALRQADETRRQFEQQAQQRLAETRADFTREKQDEIRQEATDTRREAAQARISDKLAYEGLPGSTPRNVLVAGEQAGQKAKAVGDRDAANLAALRAWGDLARGNDITLLRGNQNLNAIFDAARGQNRVAGFNARAARAQANRPLSGIGTLLQLVGGAGSLAAGAGWNPFAASASALPATGYTAGIRGPYGLLVGGV